jgi:predicted adenylyl cyclase CyaB
MVEVEIRGRLDDADYNRIRALMQKEGELLETQDREMILLRDYPGYSHDPIVRETDIRLRNTNGNCEIMLKRKTADHNVARSELSLKLQGSDLTSAKEIMKALGFARGIWMHRKKEVYRYKGIEWSLVDVPLGLRYFEAEEEVADTDDAEAAHKRLIEAAQALGLDALDPQSMKAFIAELDTRVNKEISW